MLIIKDFFHKIYLKISNSKFIKCIFPIFIICLVPNVFAYDTGGYDLTFGNSVQFYNYSSTSYTSIVNLGTSFNDTYGVYASSSVNTGNYGIASGVILNGFVQPNHWYMLVYATSKPGTGCAMPGNFTNQFKVAPNFNTGVSTRVVELVNPGVIRSVVNNSFDTYDACVYSVAFRVNQLSDRILMPMNSFSSDTGYWYFFGYYLNDLGSSDSLTGTQLNTAIYDTRQSIINMQNSINNSISNQTDSVNNNIDDEFNKLKNQDHSYNQNASDNVPDKNNISNVTTAESDLLDRVNLDASSIDVTLSSNTTNFIWDIVTNLRASNGKITLLFTSILSLAIIKMVLNR